jgi:hypothetical protein
MEKGDSNNLTEPLLPKPQEGQKKEAIQYDPAKKWLGYFFMMLHVVFFCSQ